MRFGSVLQLLAGIIAFGLISACTGAPPELVSVEINLEYVDNLDLEQRYEQLNVFALVRDQDGFGDIRELYLISDESELYWRFNPDNWTHRRLAGENWIGSAGVTMADWVAVPRGQYRVVVIDAAGEQDERTVSIDAPPLAAVQDLLPQIDRLDATVTIPKGGTLLYLVHDDENEDGLMEPDRSLSAGKYHVDELLLENGAGVEGYLYVAIGSYYGSLSGPIRR